MLRKNTFSAASKLKAALMALALVAAASVSTSSVADSIEYEIEIGTSPSFSFSYLHAATNQMQNSGYYANGALLLALRGTLSGTWDTGSETFTAGSSSLLNGTFENGATAANLQAEFGVPSVAGSIWQVEITGGSVATSTGGSLSYNLLHTHPTTGLEVVDTGTFYFDPAGFPGAPNSISDDRVDLWGNNWTGIDADARRAGYSSFNGVGAIGIDLGGGGEIVPTPTAALAGIAMFGGMFLRRRIK